MIAKRSSLTCFHQLRWRRKNLAFLFVKCHQTCLNEVPRGTDSPTVLFNQGDSVELPMSITGMGSCFLNEIGCVFVTCLYCIFGGLEKKEGNWKTICMNGTRIAKCIFPVHVLSNVYSRTIWTPSI